MPKTAGRKTPDVPFCLTLVFTAAGYSLGLSGLLLETDSGNHRQSKGAAGALFVRAWKPSRVNGTLGVTSFTRTEGDCPVSGTLEILPLSLRGVEA